MHPHLRASQLTTLPDAQLWTATKAAHKANSDTLHTLPDSILQSIAWGEAVALLWGLRWQAPRFPRERMFSPSSILRVPASEQPYRH